MAFGGPAAHPGKLRLSHEAIGSPRRARDWKTLDKKKKGKKLCGINNILVLSCLLDAICELNLCSNIRRLMFKKEFDTSYEGFNSGSELLSRQNLCNAYLDFKIHPNCYSRVISVNGDEHIIIFAKRDIKQWEELTYDYRNLLMSLIDASSVISHLIGTKLLI
uniref:SET domain-containing protein n=1 Tax=Glycine max TaxID=3847 RepID=A0A0R0EIG0_SOYBN